MRSACNFPFPFRERAVKSKQRARARALFSTRSLFRNCLIYRATEEKKIGSPLALRVPHSAAVAPSTLTLAYEKSVAPANIFSRCLHC